MTYISNIPEPIAQQRVLIVGGGFAGLKLALKLNRKHFQVVLIDRNNFHQFQPLFYQVATAGLEPSAISFPFRRLLQKKQNIYFRMAEALRVNSTRKELETNVGTIRYDWLVLAMGADTNYFGMQGIEANAVPMKSVSEALYVRNLILQNFEKALNIDDAVLQSKYLNVVIVGGGPTGVELAGAIAEMRAYVLPKDYPELDFAQMNIYLLEASPRLLNGMSELASRKATSYLEKLGVEVKCGSQVKDYDGNAVLLADQSQLNSKTVLWAAGIKANHIEGLPNEAMGRGERIIVDEYNRLQGSDSILAIGDLALMSTYGYTNGHPQVAQVAMQQAKNVARNLHRALHKKAPLPFHYVNKGSLATVGRNAAVADLPFMKFYGTLAWFLWLFVHLMSILGVKNKLLIFIDWAMNYITYDQSLRVMIKPKVKKQLVK